MNPAIEILETALSETEAAEREDRQNGKPDEADKKAVKAGHIRKALNTVKDNEEIPINPGSICSSTDKDGNKLKELRLEVVNDIPTYRLYLRDVLLTDPPYNAIADDVEGVLRYNNLKID